MEIWDTIGQQSQLESSTVSSGEDMKTGRRGLFQETQRDHGLEIGFSNK